MELIYLMLKIIKWYPFYKNHSSQLTQRGYIQFWCPLNMLIKKGHQNPTLHVINISVHWKKGFHYTIRPTSVQWNCRNALLFHHHDFWWLNFASVTCKLYRSSMIDTANVSNIVLFSMPLWSREHHWVLALKQDIHHLFLCFYCPVYLIPTNVANNTKYS